MPIRLPSAPACAQDFDHEHLPPVVKTEEAPVPAGHVVHWTDKAPAAVAFETKYHVDTQQMVVEVSVGEHFAYISTPKHIQEQGKEALEAHVKTVASSFNKGMDTFAESVKMQVAHYLSTVFGVDIG